MVTPPCSRAEVLRACLSLLAGWPAVNLNETRDILLRRLTTDDFELVENFGGSLRDIAMSLSFGRPAPHRVTAKP